MVGHLDNPEVLLPYFSIVEEPPFSHSYTKRTLPRDERRRLEILKRARRNWGKTAYLRIPYKYKATTKTLKVGHSLLLGVNIFLTLLPIAWRRI